MEEAWALDCSGQKTYIILTVHVFFEGMMVAQTSTQTLISSRKSHDPCGLLNDHLTGTKGELESALTIWRSFVITKQAEFRPHYIALKTS